jgi:HemY protein
MRSHSGASARSAVAHSDTCASPTAIWKTTLAVARAALDAHEFAEARASLKPISARSARGDPDGTARGSRHRRHRRAREWMARAVHAALDPVWTADGLIAENWMPVSPATGQLDAFQWRVPVAG